MLFPAPFQGNIVGTETASSHCVVGVGMGAI